MHVDMANKILNDIDLVGDFISIPIDCYDI